MLISKLPPDLQLLISRTVSEDEWKLDSLMKAVEDEEDEVSARERVTNRSRPPTRRNEHRPPPSATSLVSSGTTSLNTPCCYCDQLHSPGTCSIVPQIEARKQILRRSGRCFSCLRKGHLVRDCRSQGRCHNCKGRHHSSICNRLTERVPNGQQSPSTSNGTTLNVTNPSTDQLPLQIS